MGIWVKGNESSRGVEITVDRMEQEVENGLGACENETEYPKCGARGTFIVDAERPDFVSFSLLSLDWFGSLRTGCREANDRPVQMDLEAVPGVLKGQKVGA